MSTRRHPLVGLAACLPAAIWLIATGAAAESHHTTSFASLLSDGEVDLSFRYRYEFVDQACCDPTQPPGTEFDEEAHAPAVRSRLSLKSGSLYDARFVIEAEDVSTVFVDDYNAGAGNTDGKRNYPQVNDPEGTEINQAYVDYSGFDLLHLRLGRQRIKLDNLRHVGSGDIVFDQHLI